MADGPSLTVGARLREARERRGISLRDIAATTRISVMSLEALERNDVARLPGGIFTRAFIRAYAAEVGLDPERTIQEFVAQFPQESPAVGAAHAASIEDGQALESNRRAIETALRLLLVSLPIAAVVIYYGTQRGAPTSGDTPEAGITSQTAAGPDVGLPAAGPPAAVGLGETAPSAEAPQTTGLTMRIAPRGPCWVSVTVDGEQSFSGLMDAGDQRQITAQDEIVLMIGDAGAFAYTLNGQPGRPLGAPGEVVSRRITVDGYRDYLLR